MEAIEINNVNKEFGELKVLKGINLTVHQGEVFTLLGENGAGKTTLINILATLSHPNAGSVKVMNHDLTEGNTIRKLISLNSQTNTVDDDFTGYENLKLIADLRNIKNQKQELTKISQRLNLDSFLHRKVKTYSGGMRRRLDIAMSLIGDPEIIFLDEPTTGVDPKNRLEIWQIIREIKEAGKTIFLTTQYLDEADQLSDHIGFINDGKIVLYGTPEQIKKNVNNSYSITVTDIKKTITTLSTSNIDFTRVENIFEISASDAQLALQLLLHAEIEISDFHKIETNLETVFLDTTKKDKANEFS